MRGESVLGDAGDAKKNGRVDGWLTTKEKVGKADDKDKKNGDTGTKKSKMLVVVGTYSIGKERIVKGVLCLYVDALCAVRDKSHMLTKNPTPQPSPKHSPPKSTATPERPPSSNAKPTPSSTPY